ncbi:MAG: aldolase/citrate lyase family protein, partial [Roseicyclus sp.]
MPAPDNALKSALATGKALRGPFLSLGSEAVTGIAGRAGFDFCLIDAEHGPFDPGLIARQLVALAACGTPAAVRVPANETWIIRQVLDMGAQTVMVPMVGSAAEAEAVV